MCSGEHSLSRTCSALCKTSERKTTRCGLLPGDPEDAARHHIVLRTKATHLDPGQLPCFPGSYPSPSSLLFPLLNSYLPYSGILTGLVSEGAGTGRGQQSEGVVRFFLLMR